MLQREGALERRLELGAAADGERDHAELLAAMAALRGERAGQSWDEQHCDDQVAMEHGASGEHTCKGLPRR